MITKVKIFSILLLLMFLYDSKTKSTFSGERLAEACISYIESKSNFETQVEILQEIPSQEFESDNITAGINTVPSLFNGYCRLDIGFYDSERLIKTLPVSVNVRLFGNVPVTTSIINKGDEISTGSFKMLRAEITGIDVSTIAKTDEIIKMRASGKLPKGTIITSDLLRSSEQVKRGQEVTLLVQSGAVQILARGTSLSDASVGESIRVQRDGAGSVITGLLDNGAIVKVQR